MNENAAPAVSEEGGARAEAVEQDASAEHAGQRCPVCPHACVLREGRLGVCGVRTEEAGEIVSLNYGRATALSLDPIEKKPLAHFHPGTMILSYGSYGCNLRCPFCQNNDIACARADDPLPTRYVSPEALVKHALAVKGRGNIGIAFTYNEPFIAPEYLIETARLAHRKDLFTVAVTNGYVMPEVWKEGIRHIDAMNIDLKCFTDESYRRLGAPGGYEVVRASIGSAHEAGVHVEVTTLVVPGISDDAEGFDRTCAWLASISPRIPLHISRFFPQHLMSDASPTDLGLMQQFRGIARRHLDFVHLGNV